LTALTFHQTFFGFISDTYTGYTRKELELNHSIKKRDYFFFPLFLALYLFGGWALSARQVDVPHATEQSVFLSGICALVSGFVIHQHRNVIPTPKEENEHFLVVKSVGRWIFLTRQCLALGFIHMTSTFLAYTGILPSLVLYTYSMTLLIAGLSIFVTIQYFILVWPHPDFAADVIKWRKLGIPFGLVCGFVHVPCGFIAIFDILILRDPSTLRSLSPSLTTSLAIYLGYVTFYIALVMWNYTQTGNWPYGLMKGLGLSKRKWAVFLVGQFAVVSMFQLLSRALMHLPA